MVHVWKDVTNVTEVLADGYDVLRKLRENRIRGGVILLTNPGDMVGGAHGGPFYADY